VENHAESLDPGNYLQLPSWSSSTNDGACSLCSGGRRSTILQAYVPVCADGTPLWIQVCHQRHLASRYRADDCLCSYRHYKPYCIEILTERRNPVHSCRRLKVVYIFRAARVDKPRWIPVSPTNPWKPCADFLLPTSSIHPIRAQEAQCRSHR